MDQQDTSRNVKELVAAAEHLLQMAFRLERRGPNAVSSKAFKVALKCADRLEKLHENGDGLNRGIQDFLLISAGESLKPLYAKFRSGELTYVDLRKSIIAWMTVTLPFSLGTSADQIEILDRALASLSEEDLRRDLEHSDVGLDEKRREGIQEATDHIVGKLYGYSGSYVSKLRSKGLEHAIGIELNEEWKESAIQWICGTDIKPAESYIARRNESRAEDRQFILELKDYVAKTLPEMVSKKLNETLSLDERNLPESGNS